MIFRIINQEREVGGVEVPPGILYHFCEFDDDGRIGDCGYDTPTSQNYASIQRDLKERAARCADRGTGDGYIELLAQMLVCSYDTCISCSVH
jgi:coenzyme F420-reducing hydrogenase alpha subunit